MYLQLSKLNKSYEIAKTLIEDLNLIVSDGNRLGIIGRNGEGKTTLLKLIAGVEKQDSGEINLSSPDLTIGYHSQFLNLEEDGDLTLEKAILKHFPVIFELNNLIELLSEKTDAKSIEELIEAQTKFEEAGGYLIQSKIDEALIKLNLQKVGTQSLVKNLSGGEKTKLQLARILVQNPDVLLLDEPTNHLDLESIEFLENFINKRNGITIIVSHDRKFLNNVANQILELEKGKWKLYFGNYDDYKTEKNLDRERLDQQIKRNIKDNDKLRSAISDKRSKVHRNMTLIPNKKKFGRHAKTIARNRAGKQAKSARIYQERFDRRNDESNSIEEARFRKLGFKISAEKVGGSDFALRIENLEVCIDPVILSKHAVRVEGSDSSNIINPSRRTRSLGITRDDKKILVSNASLEIQPSQRVAIIGNNGAGKTTLLKKIIEGYFSKVEEIKFSKTVQVEYYSQEHDEINDEKTLIENLREAVPMTVEEAARHLFWMQFEIHQINNKASTLSQGEKSKLALTKLLIKKHNFLILDEPTNHLDIPSLEVLEEALNNYEGTILTVSHDRYFLESIGIEKYYKIENQSLNLL